MPSQNSVSRPLYHRFLLTRSFVFNNILGSFLEIFIVLQTASLF